MPTETEPQIKTKQTTSFTGDALKLMTGTTFAQILGVLVAPLLTRLYAPEAFGIAALFGSITGILGVISCMRYELSIMLPNDDREAANLIGVCLAFVLLFSLLSIPTIWFGKGPVLRWLKAPELAPYLWLIPPTVFISGIFLALNYWNSRTRHFGRLSIARVTTSVATTFMTLGVGYAGYATGGTLIGAGVAGQAIATTVLGGQIWRDDASLFRRSIRWRAMSEVMKHYRKFPLVDSLGSLLNVVSQQLPVLLLGVYFSQDTVGHYALASRLIFLPMTLIGGAIGQVFFQRAAAAHAKDEDLARLAEDVFRRLVTLSLLPSLMLMVIGKEVFVLIFGPNWAEAGEYVEILAPWMFFWFVASTLTALFAVMQKLESAFMVHVLLLATRVAPLILGGVYGNAYLSLTLYSLSGVVAYTIVGMWSMGLAGVAWRGPVITLRRIALRSAPAVALVLVLDVWLKATNWLVLLIGGIGLLEYAWHVVRSDPEIKGYVSSALRLLDRRAG